MAQHGPTIPTASEMLAGGFADRTRESYLWAVTRLVRFYHRSPEQISDEEIQAYLVHLIRDRQLIGNPCTDVGSRVCATTHPSSSALGPNRREGLRHLQRRRFAVTPGGAREERLPTRFLGEPPQHEIAEP